MTGGCVEWLSNTETSAFERTTQTSSDMGQTKTLEIPSYLENKTKMCTLLIANRIRILLMIDDYYKTSLISDCPVSGNVPWKILKHAGIPIIWNV